MDIRYALEVRPPVLDDAELGTAIVRVLYEARMRASDHLGAIDVAKISAELGEPAQRIALMCRELKKTGDLVRDEHVMGRYRISDRGFTAYDPTRHLS